jgi:ferredoxin
MKKLRLIIISLVILVISIGLLYAQDNQGHCGKCQGHGDTKHEEKVGIVEKTDTALVLKTESSKTAIKLIFTEKVEALADSIVVGETYAFKGKTVKSGFMVHDFSQVVVDKAAPKGYTVIANKCIGCRLCVKNCPTKAITMVKGKAVIDQEKCIECGICVNGNNKFKGCPVKAIKKNK